MKSLSVTEIAHKATITHDRPFQLTRHQRKLLRALEAATDISEIRVSGHRRRMARVLAYNGFVRLQGDFAFLTAKGVANARTGNRSNVNLAKIKNGANAIRWALREHDHSVRDNANGDVVAFLQAWADGSVVTAPEWGEYRYWATGEHE